jgi:hypothetical protein
MITTDELYASLKRQIAYEAVSEFREALSREFMIAPFSDCGVVPEDKERGDGFAIFIGEWRLGWFATRSEACDVAQRLDDAIRQHPVRSHR